MVPCLITVPGAGGCLRPVGPTSFPAGRCRPALPTPCTAPSNAARRQGPPPARRRAGRRLCHTPAPHGDRGGSLSPSTTDPADRPIVLATAGPGATGQCCDGGNV